jgi:hypothetical protein
MRIWKISLMAGILTLCECRAVAQTTTQAPPPTQQNPMPGMDMSTPALPEMSDAEMFLMQKASGTDASPISAPMKMLSFQRGSWDLMFHGEGFISDVQQTGPRGADKFFSTNWFMGMAEHKAGKGAFSIRAMVSLEPATVTGRYYPELFQTGETAFGKPLVDGQHPHNYFMELSV